MPVAIRHTPSIPPVEEVAVPPEPVKLRVVQARVLSALLPDDLDADPTDYPTVPMKLVASRIGVSSISDAVRRAMRGLPEGSSSGGAHKGLVALGFAEEVTLNIDGLREICFRITVNGVATITEYLAKNTLPPLRNRASCINDRYKKAGD